ncbi:protein gp37 [Balnearium lithotrophicum]|uniref:Protein gp37 n=1 Tax=Balnearium lithotrophicum TaxID=223788 RepID=A0A521CK85_9BACT|nr:DUF5131 family protein [Balnearium lithotrophicum]SMO59822.1 protein gp37 [Balnearium lithotrophicum]
MSTKIDWCDEVWNPVWGCLHGCPFCYARKFARRFYRNIAKSNNLSPKDTKRLKNFQPVFLPKNFARKFSKGEGIIFVNSMSDIVFWKRDWIEKVFERIEQEQDKIFLFLSKNPKSYKKFPEIIPENVWIGVSATNNLELTERTKVLLKAISKFPEVKLFISLEPLLKSIRDLDYLQYYKWVIVGPLTGRKYHPFYQFSNSWIKPIKEFCKKKRIAFFTKDAAKRFGIELIKEFPF